MSNLELFDRFGQLSRAEKFQMVQLLMSELAKKEGLKPLVNQISNRGEVKIAIRSFHL